MSDEQDKKPARGLGRGLTALMADVELDAQQAAPERPARRNDTRLPVEALRPNPNQPRRAFATEDLDNLAASIREKGILQPLIVRPDHTNAGTFEIVAGERRWRAAQLAQLHEVPVLIRELSDTEVLEVAIIENIQRADLNPVEEALGFRQLMDRFGHTQEKLAEALGKSRSHIANLLRLLNLPGEVMDHLRDGRLTAGHARALVGHEDAVELARTIARKGLSVRQTEAMVKRGPPEGKTRPGTAPKRPEPDKDADTRALELDLSATTGLRIEIDHDAGSEGGRVVISYADLDQLDEVCRLLTGPGESR